MNAVWSMNIDGRYVDSGCSNNNNNGRTGGTAGCYCAGSRNCPKVAYASKNFFLIIILLLILHTPHISANWLYFAISGFSPPHNVHPQRSVYPGVEKYCSHLPFLNEQQKKICSSHPYAMLSVGHGARDSILECQGQFKFERWNCTTKRTANDSAYDFFGTTLRAVNKEAAFLHAVTSAGLVHAVTRGCSQGNLTDCSCDVTKQGEGRDSTGKFLWGGCSDNVKYGVKFSRDFLDKYEKQLFVADKHPRHLIAVHNHEVGRDAVSNLNRMRRICRCHGVSGSCEFRTCWQQMPKFNEIGEYLKTLYDRASVQVAKRVKRKLRRKEKSERKIPIRQNELVFLTKSPNYCLRDDDSGIFGTRGRECNKSSYGADSCDMLCCGRGYDTRVVTKTERCQCKFVWCCYVKCKDCVSDVDVHTCK